MRRQTKPSSGTGSGVISDLAVTNVIWNDIAASTKPGWSWRSKKQAPGLVLLGKCSGRVDAGEMHLILGPSGSGKTLLLQAIAGYQAQGAEYSGHVLVNGSPRSSAAFFRQTTYLQASTEHLDPLMTVQESMQFASDLGSPHTYTAAERMERIDIALVKLGLMESKSKRTTDLSHGERKRLCIAQHLLRDPRILLLDEPTSGLDATSAKTLVAQLHAMAEVDNIIMIMSLHRPRPETFERFTSVTVMAQGRPVYEGPVASVIGHFEGLGHYCPADACPAQFILDLVTDRDEGFIQDLAERWKQSGESDTSITGGVESKTGTRVVRAGYNAGWWTEYKVLLAREVLHFSRGGSTWTGLIIANLLLALFFGFLWFQIPDDGYQAVQNRIGLIMFFPRDRSITIATLIVVAGFIGQVKAERRLVLYRSSSFYSALMTFYCGTELILNTFYALIIYYIAGLRYTPFTAMLTLMGLHLLLLISVYSIALIIPFCIGNQKTAFIAGMTIWYMMALYNGLLVNLSDVSWIIRWPCYLSPEFYYFTGGLQNEFNGQTLDGESGEYWLSLYALDSVPVVWCAGALLIINAACALGSYLTIKYRTRPRLSF